ncbi:MAG: TonB-dependent receptor [Bacteroidales bacterium]|nr:TonB-dependent receptor [Bacteroidales bacterium]
MVGACFMLCLSSFAQSKGDTVVVKTIESKEDSTKIRTISESKVIATSKPAPTLQTAPVQVVDRSAIERMGISELHEALKSFSGVNIKDYGGIGGLKTVSVRSLGAQHTAVSYDGIAISNVQSGQVDISRFSLDNVDQVSLVIGQSDNIFRTARLFASAGALEISTIKPIFVESGINVAAQMKFASFGTYNPSLTYEQRLGEKWSVSVVGDYLTSKGEYPFKLKNGTEETTQTRLNSDVKTLRGEINVYGNFNKGGKLSFKGNYLDSERGLPGSVVLYNINANERLWDRNAFAHTKYEVDLSEKWALKSSLKYSYAWNRYTDINEKYPSGKVDDRYAQQEYYGSVALQYAPYKYLCFTAAEDVFVNTLDATIPECPFPERFNSLTSIAGQFKNERLTVTASVLGTMVSEKVKIGTAAPSRKNLSPAVGISYKLSNDYNIRVRASYKDVYRVPTFNDLYYSRVGNINLKPERATQYNVGITWSGQCPDKGVDYASISVDSYYNKVKDKIVAIPTLFIWKMMNMGQVDIAGVDANISATFGISSGLQLGISGNYSYQYAVDVSDYQSKTYKHQIPYTPLHSGNMNVSMLSKWVNFSYMLSAVGDRYALPQNVPSNRIDGYFEHTVSVNRGFELFGLRLKIQGEVINLTNRMYDVIQYYPMPGRSYRLTLKINY